MLNKNPFDKLLAALPIEIRETVKNRIDDTLNYEPRIGVIGKTGSGKSSLINAIFNADLCQTDAVKGCTRGLQKERLNVNGRYLTFIDFPGIGESIERDKEYIDLYSNEVGNLDLILWVVKVDDRSFTNEQYFYDNTIKGRVDDRVLFIVSQVDKVSPGREWDRDKDEPGPTQLKNIEQKKQLIIDHIGQTKNPIVAVSAEYGYNLSTLVASIIFSLPKEIQANVAGHVRQEHFTEQTKEKVDQSLTSTIFDIVKEVAVGSLTPLVAKTVINAVPTVLKVLGGFLGKIFRF